MTQLSYRPGDLAIAPSDADGGAGGAGGAASARLRLDAVLHRAVLRDLDRLTSVLAGPVTAVRRSALIGHVTFLTGELRRHWQLQDELIWPRAVAGDPSLAGAADQVRDDHLAAAAQCAGLVTAAERWARVGDAEHRLLVLDAVREVAAVLATVFERDGDVTAVALGALTSRDRGRHRPGCGPPPPPAAAADDARPGAVLVAGRAGRGERGGAVGRRSAAADVGAAQRVQRRVQPRVVPDVGRRRAGRAGLTARRGLRSGRSALWGLWGRWGVVGSPAQP